MTDAAGNMDDALIVIGSGPTGAAAASRLVARGRDVVLLDSGKRAPRGLVVRAAGNTLFRYRSPRELSSDRLSDSSTDGSHWFSSLSLGGLSNYWTAAVPRFHPEDFTDGRRIDEKFAWPVTAGDLEPYYAEAEGLLRVTAGGPMLGVPSNVLAHTIDVSADWGEVVAAAAADGVGFGPIPLAKGAPWMAALRPSEFSSYHNVIRPLERGGSLRVVPHAHVSRIVWSESAQRATGVEYVDRATGRPVVLHSDGVIVAAGTIDTTMILLRSVSSSFPTGLGNTEGLLGTHLHDHPREWWIAELERPMRALAHPLYIARRDHLDSEPLMATSLTIGLATPRERLRTFIRGTTDRVGVQVFGTMIPDAESTMAIDDPLTDDPVGQRPRVSLRYDDLAVENLLSARDRFIDVMSSAGLRVSLPGPFHDLEPGSSVHHAGTVRMHADRRHGVLDGWNRMHDVPNVAVCDMSAFTTSPEKNPTLTAMALALRAVDRLADDLA